MLRVVAPLDHRYKVLTDDVRVTLLPAQTAVDPDAVIVGVAGSGLTTMVVASEERLVQPKLLVTCTV
jgi:hypothetical protein